MKKNGSLKKILSAVIALTMAMSLVLPITVFATVTTPVAVATVIENGGGGQTKTITVTFTEEVADLGAVLDTDISVAGKTFGASTMVLDAVTNKELVITLASDATVAVGEDITFANNKIAKADDLTDFFNGDVAITGSLDNATIDYSGIVPGDATITVDGYLTNPTSVGTGTFNYTLTRTNYVTKVSSFTITASDLGNTYVVTDSMEKNAADYTAIDAKIAEAGTYLAANYTATSYAALQTALTNANAVDRSLKFDSQSTVDTLTTALQTAIDGLVAKKTVNFMAVAVADDADVNYAKATKIVLVFAEPIMTGADMLSNLSIKSDIASAVWADAQNTVYELTIKPTANLANGTVITYTTNDAIKTKLGVVLDTTSATVVGNLEEASALVTATDMSATIVKSSGKPGVVAGDKIVIVFNAPVKDKPASITVNGMTANAVASTNNTVYEIILAGTESVSNSTTLTYSTMSTGLNGSFGSAVAPKAIKAYAVDNDGTELVENDEIVVKFDIPTNCASDISKISLIGTGYTASLGSSTLSWDSTKTKLSIKLASDAVIKDGAEIDLKTLGIKDEYGIIDADVSTLVPKISGSFGYSIQPKIVKAIAFSQGTYDYIRVFFNTAVEFFGTKDEPTFSNEFSMGAGAEYDIVTSGGLKYYEIKMNKSAHSALQPGTTIALTGIVDYDTKSKFVAGTPYAISGGFVSPITPEIIRVVAISTKVGSVGSGKAKQGDKIIAIFNTEISAGNSTAQGGKSFGAGYTENVTGNVLEITLGDNPTIGINDEIKFDGFKDSATLSAVMPSTTKSIEGTFGKVIKPEILSATVYSKDGSGIAKAGDEIIAIFNMPVNVNAVTPSFETCTSDVNKIIWTIALSASEATAFNENTVKIGDNLLFVVTSVATNDSWTLDPIKLGGSFGFIQENKVISTNVYYSEAKKAEIIDLVFSAETNGNSGLITTPTVVEKLVENNPKLDIVSASFVDNYTFRIQLGSGSTIIEGDDITLKNLNITDKKTGKVIADNDLKHAVSGAVIPIVQKAEVVDTVITVTFSARTNGAGISNILAQKALYGTGVTAEWQSNNTKLVITMSNDNTMSNDAYIVLNGLGIKDGFSGTYDIVGQYKIDTTNLTKKTLNITSVFVKANDTDNAPRADVTKGLAGDNIIVKFEDVTDKLAGSDASANIILDDAGDSFGTGYTAIWSDSKTIEVTLGTDPVITNSSKVIIKDVKFANGTGYLASGGATQVTKELTGQFDGKRYWITNVAKTTTKERVRVTGTVSTEYNGVKPFVVCQAMTASNTVLSISAVKLNDVASSDVVFDFSATNVAKIKMFVVDGDYADETATITPLSEVVEK